MEWFKKKMRVFLFVCLLFPFYSYAAKISLSISGKIEDHSAMLYFPDGRRTSYFNRCFRKGRIGSRCYGACLCGIRLSLYKSYFVAYT